MDKLARIKDHLLENSTLYLTALLALGIALFEIWGNESLKSKLKVLRSIIYILIFVLTILSIKKFNVCKKCAKNEREKYKEKLLIQFRTFEGILDEALENNNNPINKNYINDLKNCFKSLDNLILKVKESKTEDDNTSKEKNS